MMEVVIVGHGKSLIGKKMGEYIDTLGDVVRFPLVNGGRETDEDHGTRTDYVAAPYTCLRRIRKPAKEFWIIRNFGYPHKINFPEHGCRRALLETWKEYNPIIFSDIMFYWQDRFLELHSKWPKWSRGMLAIIVTSYHLRPDTLHLAGFDNLKSGTEEIIADGTGHDYECERLLMEQITNKYKINVRYFP